MRYFCLFFLIFNWQIVNGNISYDLVSEKLEHLIHKVDSQEMEISEALLKIDEEDMGILLKPSVIYSENQSPMFEGWAACSGVAQGVLCFDARKITQLKKEFGSVIWVANQLNNDDLCYIKDIAGICTFKEDPSSHAIIVTRVNNIPCLTLIKEATLEESSIATANGILKEGDLVTLDAFNGQLFRGALPIFHPQDTKILDKVMEWTDAYAQLEVCGNADTSIESLQALSFGAKGVDPRTEHMFFHPDSLHIFRKVILGKGECEEALEQLKSIQKKDFIDLFRVMQAYPAKIRLLDPPFHEFLPSQESPLAELAGELDLSLSEIKRKVEGFSEVNPMLGHRGVRLLLTYPQILRMQARAIFEAAIDPLVQEYNIEPYITIPMIISDAEVVQVKDILDEVRDEVSKEFGRDIVYHLGVMIETPRACILADKIAQHVEFFSFGTNDLTGLTLGLSRGDVYDKFLKHYFDEKLLSLDPFSEIDAAVSHLMQITVDHARAADHYVSVGICGEQAGERLGVFTCHNLGLDTVSCAPTRVPLVRLFAAQAAILQKSR